MSSSSRELPEFFKVYLPEYSKDRLRIPTAFIKHFNGLVPETAMFRHFNGRVWHVEVGQIQKEVFFLKGWPQFLTDNSVEEGDFLVFRYDGYHVFDFRLFGRTACDKVNTDIYQKDVCVKEEKDVEEVETEEEEEEGDKEEEEKEGDEEEEEKEEEEEDKDEEEENKDENVHEEEEEDSTEEEEESPSEKEEKEPEYSRKKVTALMHKPPTGGYKQTAARNAGIEYIGTSLSKSKCLNCSQALSMVGYSLPMTSILEPRNPYFNTRIGRVRLNRVHIPSDVLKDHNIELPPKVIFRDPLGRKWPGTVTVWKDGRTWLGGWRAFCKWNHLKANDTCTCELVLDGDQQLDDIVVHIHRA